MKFMFLMFFGTFWNQEKALEQNLIEASRLHQSLTKIHAFELQ
jgi:hypothetical protein